MKACLVGLAFGAMLVSPVSPVAAGGAAQKHVHRVFDIMREGSRIGTNTFDIVRQGDTTKVGITTHIQVKVAFITAYRYDHSEMGTFKGTQLVAFKSSTDDNGTSHAISAARAGDKLALTVDGEAASAPKSIVPASLWGADVSKQPQIFDPANGKRMAVQTEDLGEETVSLNGAPRLLRHVKLSGPFARDVWFDEDGLVKMNLLGSDNSLVTSQLRQSTASN